MRALKRTRGILVAAVFALTSLPIGKALSYPRKEPLFLRANPIVEASSRRIEKLRVGAIMILFYKKKKGEIIEHCIGKKDRKNLDFILSKVFKAPDKKVVDGEMIALSIASELFQKPDKRRIVLAIAIDNVKTFRALSRNKQGAEVVRATFRRLASISPSAQPVLRKIEAWVFSKEDREMLALRLSKG
jgi:hypothetical protein